MKFLATSVLVVLLVAHPSNPRDRAAAEDQSAAAMMARIEGAQTPDRQGYDRLTLAQLMERLRVPGVAVAVIRDFDIHWAKGYGKADVTTGAPVTNETIFQAASIGD